MKNLGIILARKNSKRLKNKNILKISGLKLIEYTIKAAISSKKFYKIIVSTDDPRILKLKFKYKSIFFHKRKKNLSSDKIKVNQVVKSIILDLKDNSIENLALMLPTCPLRNSIDIKKAFKLKNTNVDSVVSVCEYAFPPQLSLVIKKNKYGNYFLKNSPYLNNKTRSQSFETVYHPNGGIYISSLKKFLNFKSFFKGKMRLYVMPRHRSVDIETKTDFELAKFFYKKKYK